MRILSPMVPEQITPMVRTENESLSVCFLSLSIGSIVQKILLGLLGKDKRVNLATIVGDLQGFH